MVRRRRAIPGSRDAWSGVASEKNGHAVLGHRQGQAQGSRTPRQLTIDYRGDLVSDKQKFSHLPRKVPRVKRPAFAARQVRQKDCAKTSLARANARLLPRGIRSPRGYFMISLREIFHAF